MSIDNNSTTTQADPANAPGTNVPHHVDFVRAPKEALPLFSQAVLAAKDTQYASQLGVYSADSNTFPEAMNTVGFSTPRDIIISRWYPGYREADLSGKAADEAVGLQLADRLASVSDLETFRRVLTLSEIAVNVIAELLPRSGVPVRRGVYMISEARLATTVSNILSQSGVTEAAVVSAYTYVFNRVLSSLGLVQSGPAQKIVMMASSYAVSSADLRNVVMVDALRDIFSEARLASVSKMLDQDAVPDVIADVISRMLANLALTIPEVKLRLQQLETAMHLVSVLHLAPDRISDAVASNTALQALASYANFVAMSVDMPTLGSSPVAAVAEQREACQAVLSAIQSAPSIEVISLTSFAKHFGVVPGASPEGLARGAVVYLANAQTSKMDVVDAYTKADGTQLQLVPTTYVPATLVAPELNRSVLTSSAMQGVANLVADEMGEQPVDLGDAPIVACLGVTPHDLRLLAMARALSLSFAVNYAADGSIGTATLVYSARVSEQWRQRVLAATTSTAFFTSPVSLIAYTSVTGTEAEQPMPARPQTFKGLSEVHPVMYRGTVDRHLGDKLERRVGLRLPLRHPSRTDSTITVNLLVLSPLLGVDANGNTAPRGALDRVMYRSIKEPGVDRDLFIMLQTISQYASAGSNTVIADRAKSWLVEVFVGLTVHPVVRQMAERAINEALISAGLDGRSLTSQMRELVTRASFGTALVILAQFEKIPLELAFKLTQQVPMSNLTVSAQMALATLRGQVTSKL